MSRIHVLGWTSFIPRLPLDLSFLEILEVTMGSSRPEARDFDKDSTSWPESTHKALGIVLGNLTSYYEYLTKTSRRLPCIAALMPAEI